MLIRRFRQDRPHKSAKTLRRVILVAALIAALVALAVGGSAYRYDLFEYSITEHWQYYEITYSDAVPDTAHTHLEKVYKPTYIPDGFVLTDTDIRTIGAVYSWKTEDWSGISYQQYLIEPNDVLCRPMRWNKNLAINGVLMGDHQVLRVDQDEYIFLFWTDGEYMHYLGVTSDIPEEEILKIFHSITVDENALIPES